MALQAVVQQDGDAEVIRLDRRRPGKIRIRVSPAMLDAGRSAFLRHRRTLDDLYECFDADRDAFLRAVYRAMASAQGA